MTGWQRLILSVHQRLNQNDHSKATLKDAKAIQSLIVSAVEPETNPDFNEEGVHNFHKPNTVSAIENRISNDAYLTLCFFIEQSIVGIITVHANEKIDQLFVSPVARNMKVAKKLWLAAKNLCDEKGKSGKYWVKSSTVAIGVHESFGFKLVGARQEKNGIVYYPMQTH
jgi:GNAT superfamily N-acetyltransferase